MKKSLIAGSLALFIASTVSPNIDDLKNELASAVANYNVREIRRIIPFFGMDPNLPLLAALQHDDIKTVKFLLQYGADLDKPLDNRRWNTARAYVNDPDRPLNPELIDYVRSYRSSLAG